MTRPTLADVPRFSVGDTVEWDPFVGGTRRGLVSRIKLGRVYVKSSYTNSRGRRVSRTCECFFDAHELDRLRVITKGPT